MRKVTYAMSVHLRYHRSSEIRQLLKDHEFEIIIQDEVANEYHYYDPKMISKMIEHNRDFKLMCLYKGEYPPPQSIINRIDHDPSVISFRIDKLIE